MRALALLALLAALLTPLTASAAEIVSIGTLAPKQSVWGRTFGVWEEAVKKKSAGKLELRIFYNGQQGDDGTMVGKIRSGQLDAAAVSASAWGRSTSRSSRCSCRACSATGRRSTARATR